MVSRAVLIAVGIRSSGEREVLGVQVWDKESHAYWGGGLHPESGQARSQVGLAKVSQIYKDLDSWIRHRLRALIFKQWKRGPTIYSRVRAMGYGHDIARKAASHGSSWWRGSTGYFNIVLPDRYFDAIGVPRVA